MKRVLITGAGGFIGNRLLHVFHAIPDVQAAGTMRRKQSGPVSPLRYYAADLAKPVTIDFAPDVIIHAAGAVPGSVRNEPAWSRGNVDTMENLLTYAREKGTTQFIYLSTLDVYGLSLENAEIVCETMEKRANTPYGKTKYEAEKRLEEAAFLSSRIVLRPATVFGKGARNIWITRLIEKMKRNEPVSIYGADIPCNSLCDVQDVAEFIARLVKSESDSDDYILGLERQTTVRQVAECIRDKLGSASEILAEEGGRMPYRLIIDKAVRAGYSPSTAEEIIHRYFSA